MEERYGLFIAPGTVQHKAPLPLTVPQRLADFRRRCLMDCSYQREESMEGRPRGIARLLVNSLTGHERVHLPGSHPGV